MTPESGSDRVSGDRVSEPSEGAPVKIVVDYDKCTSNAVCMGIAPEVFEVRDDNFLYVLQEEPPEELRPKMEEAVRMCPTQAISLEG
jgi:ferredoxin